MDSRVTEPQPKLGKPEQLKASVEENVVPSTGLNCSSRGRNVPALTRVQRQPSGNPRLWNGQGRGSGHRAAQQEALGEGEQLAQSSGSA